MEDHFPCNILPVVHRLDCFLEFLLEFDVVVLLLVVYLFYRFHHRVQDMSRRQYHFHCYCWYGPPWYIGVIYAVVDDLVNFYCKFDNCENDI